MRRISVVQLYLCNLLRVNMRLIKASKYVHCMSISKIAFFAVAVILLTKPELVLVFYKSITGISLIKANKPGPLSLLAFFTRNVTLTKSA